MNKRIGVAASLALVLSAGGCAGHKKDDKKVPLDRGVTDLAPSKAVPTSAVPPDPSFVSMPAGATQPRFVPVDAPAAAVPGIDAATLVSAAPASPPPVPAQTPPAPAGPALAPAAGNRQYLVQKGDTLFRIAHSHYGNGNRWQQIAMVNPGLTPATLKAGSTITVP